MRNYTLPLVAVLAFAIALPTFAAEKPRPAQGNQTQPKKVWTNDDMDQLRAQGLISIVGHDATAAPPATTAETAPAQPTFPIYNSRLDDPDWYAKKAATLQAELDERQAALQTEQNAIAQAADRITQPGIALDQPTIGVTPQSALAILEAQVEDVQTQLDDLSDLARQNGIAPGVLRS
jgi:hypothetical protein